MARLAALVVLVVAACSSATRVEQLVVHDDGGRDALAGAAGQGVDGDAGSSGADGVGGMAGASGLAGAGGSSGTSGGPGAAGMAGVDAGTDAPADAPGDVVEAEGGPVCPSACVSGVNFPISIYSPPATTDGTAAVRSKCPPGSTLSQLQAYCIGCDPMQSAAQKTPTGEWLCRSNQAAQPGAVCRLDFRCDTDAWCPDWQAPCAIGGE